MPGGKGAESIFDIIHGDEEVLEAPARAHTCDREPKVFEKDEYLICKLPLGVIHLAAAEKVAREVLGAQVADGIVAVLYILDAIAQGEAIVAPLRLVDVHRPVAVIEGIVKQYALMRQRGRVSPVEHFLRQLMRSISVAAQLRKAVYTRDYLPYRSQFL